VCCVIICLALVYADIRASKAEYNSSTNELEVDWDSVGDLPSHKSTYPLSFLFENSYSWNRVEVPPPPSDLSLVEIDFKELKEKYPSTSEEQPLSSEGMNQYRHACGRKLQEYGCIVVRNRGLDTEEIIKDFLQDTNNVIPTHFGRIEDLRTDNTTNKNTDQLGYTDAPVNLHTDQPFIANPPGMQILQCITPATLGGENAVVDAVKTANYLRQFDPEAYQMLVSTPVRFYRQQKEFQSLHVSPILRVDDNGNVVQVRYSYFTYAPHIVPFEQMESWYRAYNKFAALVRDRQNQYFFALQSGDFVLYDNHRMLHARTGFSGPRHMRGVYLPAEDVYSFLNQ